MTEETPAKVMTLLGVALSSMFFLFVVTFTNASFQQTETSFPNPFAPEKVMAALDGAANSYSNFVAANLTRPLMSDLAFYKANVDWVIDNSDQQILALAGLQPLADANYNQRSYAPQVAGAYTSKVQPSPSPDLVDALYGLVVQQ